jgi:hypothetical protein
MIHVRLCLERSMTISRSEGSIIGSRFIGSILSRPARIASFAALYYTYKALAATARAARATKEFFDQRRSRRGGRLVAKAQRSW